jgi:hypothetical protein
MELSERFTNESNARDDIYGEYPFILYKHFFITRANIPRLCKMATDINSIERLPNLSQEQRAQIEHLEMLIMHRLHTVTVRD